MNILFVGDVHTKLNIIDLVEQLLNNSSMKIDKVVFTGDYVDDWGCSIQDNINTIKYVISFKNRYKDKIILLLGNHELSYLGHPCSGHKASLELTNLLKINIQYMDVFYNYRNILVSHGGLTENWKNLFEHKFGWQFPYTQANDALHSLDENLLSYLAIASYTSGGNGIYASPLWARPKDHKLFLVNNLIQVVGHTPIQGNIFDNIYKHCSSEIFYIDTFFTYNNETIGNKDLLYFDDETDTFINLLESNDYKLNK